MATPIEEKYELELRPITIAGKKLEIYTVSRWDAFVEKFEEQGAAYIETFPFWVKIWAASIVLTDYLMQSSLPLESEILEIGAGVGLVGLFLGARGHRVTITDYEEDALALLEKNVRHNTLKNVTIKKLDWLKPDLEGQFDCICGSELLYRETFIAPMMGIFRRYLRPGGKIFLAHDYSRKCLIQFIGLVPGNFHIKNIIRTMRGNDDIERIVVHALSVS